MAKCLHLAYKKFPQTATSPLLVATSGGADSIALLEVTSKIAIQKIIALHFNHQLRGAESDKDQLLFEDFCKSRNISFRTGTFNVTQQADQNKESLEMAARECRYKWFREMAEKFHASILLMGHHADDQAELFFIRLLRGTSLKGLGGMQFITNFPYPAKVPIYVLRPFLEQRHQDITRYLEKQGIHWAEDSTNQDDLYVRNKIRNDIIPYLEKNFSKELAPLLGRTMSLLREDDNFIQNQVDTLSQDDSVPFESLHVCIQRRILEKHLHAVKLTPNYLVIEHLIKNPGKNISVCGHNIYRPLGSSSVKFTPPVRTKKENQKYTVHITTAKGEITFPELKLSWEIVPASNLSSSKSKPENCEYFDFQKVGNIIHLRHWEPGDRYIPIGMQQCVKLQNAFTNKKIPAILRSTLWIAENTGKEIFWVQKLRIGESFKLTESTQSVLSLQIVSLIR